MKKHLKTTILLITLCAFQLNAQFTLYTLDNSDLPSHNISDIVVDYDNTAWLATDSGLVEIKNNHWVTHNAENSILPNNRIKDLYLDNYGKLFIYSDESIFKYNKNGFELVHNNVSGTTFAVDNSGNILVNSNYSLLRSNQDGWDTLIYKPEFNGVLIDEIEIDKMNNIYFKYMYYGEFWVINTEDEPQQIKQDSEGNFISEIYDISIDSNQNLWLSGYSTLYNFNVEDNSLTTYDVNSSDKFERLISRKTCVNKSNIPFSILSYNFFRPSYLIYIFENKVNEYLLDDYFSEEVIEWSVNAMAIDFYDNVWMHLNGVGLLKFDPSISSVNLLPNTKYTIYPNPTTSSLRIELENEALITSYKITNTKGKQVLTGSLSPSSLVSIDVEQLPVGVYIIELATSNGEVIIDKFVKE
ncbi:MAG: T9SS type A sorting domain-containing protein [Candidatus Kapaibacterium sp.]